MFGKTEFPYAERSGLDNPDFPYFAKRVNINIKNIPFIGTKANFLQHMELPEKINIIRLRRQNKSSESGEFYDGDAILAIFVKIRKIVIMQNADHIVFVQKTNWMVRDSYQTPRIRASLL